jgi:hypothetical protein
VLGEAGTFRIVPTFGIAVGIASDGVESALDGYARAGVGVILNRRISILSAIVVPAASDIPGPAFVVTAALGIARTVSTCTRTRLAVCPGCCGSPAAKARSASR